MRRLSDKHNEYEGSIKMKCLGIRDNFKNEITWSIVANLGMK